MVTKKKPCAVCGRRFVPANGVQKSCSEKCKAERLQEQLKDLGERRRKGWKPTPVPCAVCGTEFPPANATARYCSSASCKKEGLRRAVERQRQRRAAAEEEKKRGGYLLNEGVKRRRQVNRTPGQDSPLPEQAER